MHFNFTPLRPLLYSAPSTNWYILDCRATLSASSCSSGSSPVWRKRTICCAHVGACGSTTRTKGMSAAAGTSASTASIWGSAGAEVVGSACFDGTSPGACRSRVLLSTLGVDPGDSLGGGFGKLCRKIVAGDQLPLLVLSSRWCHGWLSQLEHKGP